MPSSASHEARISSVEQRMNKVAPKVKADAASSASSISTLNTEVAALTSDFGLLSGLAGNANFLANLSKLPNQTTTNSTISTAAGTLSNADRIIINNLVNAVNNLQNNLQNNGFEHP